MDSKLKKGRMLFAFSLALIALTSSPALADSPKLDRAPLTSGASYDRNPSVVQDGNTLWLFFARSQAAPCNRLQGCPADNTPYDLFYVRSNDKGKSWGAPVKVADNPLPPNTFYGRTVAATRRADGTIYLFWASGGNGSNLYYYKKAPNAPAFTLAGQLTDALYFNVEAVSVANRIFVYYEDGTGTGIFVRKFDGTTFTPATPVAASKSIPKVIIDRRGVFRMAMVDANVGSVYVASSVDGVNWTPATLVVGATGGVTNWDPTLVQRADGDFQLFWAPDQGDGRQRIETLTSRNFSTWSTAAVVTEGTDGSAVYWEYWPEAILVGGDVRLFYTSERGIGSDAAGTGHVWATRDRQHGHGGENDDDDGDNDNN